MAAAAHAQPTVIAHRGASGYLPEHTLEAYELAIRQGAAFIEPDLVMTKDGVLVVRHENEISETTDVASRPEFAARRTTKSVDGKQITGWFSEDFTLAELKTVRAKERIPKLRPENTKHDGKYQVAAFHEVLDLLKKHGGRIGVYPEIKHSSYFAGIGLAIEEPLVKLLEQYGYRGKDARIFIQSFEVGNLRKLSKLTQVPLVQLMLDNGRPWDFTAGRFARTYADMATPEGLADIATYAAGIGPQKSMVTKKLIDDAHAKGLKVHAWTFRAENNFLPKDLQKGADPAAHGDLAAEIRRFLAMGMDGFFTDHPDIGVAAAK